MKRGRKGEREGGWKGAYLGFDEVIDDRPQAGAGEVDAEGEGQLFPLGHQGREGGREGGREVSDDGQREEVLIVQAAAAILPLPRPPALSPSSPGTTPPPGCSVPRTYSLPQARRSSSPRA